MTEAMPEVSIEVVGCRFAKVGLAGLFGYLGCQIYVLARLVLRWVSSGLRASVAAKARRPPHTRDVDPAAGRAGAKTHFKALQKH